MAVGLLMLAACAQKSVNAVVDSEPATITWIEDKPGGTLQPHTLYPDVPDSLWSALGLQEGVPSSMSCFLLRADGKTILLDAGLGAPFSQLLPKLNELGLTPEELRLIYITHLHPDHIGGLLKDGKMAFPQAELYVNRIEAEAWQAMEGERSQLAKNVHNMRNIFPAEKIDRLCGRNMKIIEEIAERIQIIEKGVEDLVEARKVANKIENEREKAVAYHDTVAPKMEEIRYHIDKLELIVADELWTLPKYRELLFIR